MRPCLVKQGQIKTGAPCRSERLAKYNQVKRASVIGNLLLRRSFFNCLVLFLSGYCSFLELKRSLDLQQSMLDQNSEYQWSHTDFRTGILKPHLNRSLVVFGIMMPVILHNETSLLVILGSGSLLRRKTGTY